MAAPTKIRACRKFPAPTAIILIAGIGVGATAWAQQDKEKIIAERQDAMKQQGREMIAVRNYFQDKGDQATALAALVSLKGSVPKVLEWFPAGTGLGQVSVKTRAKPEIWQDQDKFVAADKTVIGQIDTLEAAVKGGDKAKTETVYNEIKFCDACHSTFRAPEQR